MENLGISLFACPAGHHGRLRRGASPGHRRIPADTHLSAGQIVMAKFFVTYLFVTLMMVVELRLSHDRHPAGRRRPAAPACDLYRARFHAIALASIGLVCSAFTSSQLVAAIAAWALGFVLWDFSWASQFVGETTNEFLDALSLHLRYGSFAEGIVNLANLVYFLGLALVAAAVARFSFEWRRVAG